MISRFLTAILHRGLRSCFFLYFRSFTFHILFGLLYPSSIWTFISLFYLDFFHSIAVTFWISSKFLFIAYEKKIPRRRLNFTIFLLIYFSNYLPTAISRLFIYFRLKPMGMQMKLPKRKRRKRKTKRMRRQMPVTIVWQQRPHL